MKLYHSPTTPFGRKVMALILEIGLGDRVEILPASGTPLAPGSMPVDLNPLGKIPALVRDEGGTIYDSRVICRYLDELAGSNLYPKANLYEVLTLEATADGILEAALLMVYEDRLRPEDKRFAEWVEGQWSKIARTLDALESSWMAHLNGPLDMGQIALGCALGYLDFRHDARGWREGRPKLAAWEANIVKRPAMQVTIPRA